MGNRVIVMVDMQVDFVSGELGTKEAQSIVPKVRDEIIKRRKEGYKVISTQDTHGRDYLSTNEGKYIPEHCIRGTKGWEIVPELWAISGTRVLKSTFGKLDWDLGDAVEEIELVGLCTDICVISNAIILKSVYPEARIVVNASCCAGVTAKSHELALELMRLCQIDIIGL